MGLSTHFADFAPGIYELRLTASNTLRARLAFYELSSLHAFQKTRFLHRDLPNLSPPHPLHRRPHILSPDRTQLEHILTMERPRRSPLELTAFILIAFITPFALRYFWRKTES